MLPFNRLVQAMDRWAGEHPAEQVFAQIGDGSYEPQNMSWTRLLTPQKFAELARSAALLVAHAGTGSYFLAAELSKPVVMLPRLSASREHTTDHQVHTAMWLRDKPGVYVALAETELPGAIALALDEGAASVGRFVDFAPEPFLARIRDFLQDPGRAPSSTSSKEIPDGSSGSRWPWQNGPFAPRHRKVPS